MIQLKVMMRQILLFQLSQEFAGLGGNVGFFKNELELQVLQSTYQIFKSLSHSGPPVPVTSSANQPIWTNFEMLFKQLKVF